MPLDNHNPSDPYTQRAIETRFDGVLFRSRTEARWAAFFKRLGVSFEYEPHRFDLGSGSGLVYTPDFFLSTVNCYAEVKPTVFTRDERTKAILLSRVTRSSVILLTGLPDYRPYETVSDGQDPESDWIILTDTYLDENRFYSGAGENDGKDDYQWSDTFHAAIERSKSFLA